MNTSKFLALLLRHKPELLDISLDEHGWANVQELIDKINHQKPFNMTMLEEIVTTDSKNRFSFNEDKTLIRANQGHSINVDVDLKESTPPVILYHGTVQKFVDSINKQGLLPQSRLYVHLSQNIQTARSVGRRHGADVIVYEIDAATMKKDGLKFYLSQNNVWLTKFVPAKYLKIVQETI